MKRRLRNFYILIVALFTIGMKAQTYTLNPYQLGTTCATCIVNNNNPKGGNPNNNVMNGNGIIANSYVATACGLNYTMGKVKLGKRLPTPGVNQPAAISITGLPVCRVILKAYLYVGGSGNGININATVTNPAATSQVFAMTQIGNHVDKCWGYTGTYNYRADITALISGNGNYMVSGIPTNPPVAGNDMDGASIVIVYQDLSQTYTGHIVIGDGCQVGIGGQQTSNITGWNACAASSFASAFMIVGDLQNVGIASCFMNSAAANFNYPSASQDWWDNIIMNPAPNVTAGQNSATFGLNSGGDCYNIVAAGLYYRTACNVCVAGNMTVTTAVTNTCTAGSATAFVTGGSAPYSYTWTPSALTTSAINNVAPGNYTVTVKDASGCLTGTALAVIPANSTTISATGATICLGKSGTITASGGNTYTWTPSATLSSPNGSAVVANPLSTTVYSVTGTNSLGCTGTTTVQVTVNPLPTITVNNPTACVNSNFTLTATGGTAYAWSGPNGFNSALQNPPFSAASTSLNGNYTVVVTSAQGCTNSAVGAVSVTPLPTVTIAGTNTICSQNFNSSINTVALNGSGASSYTWTLPAGYSASPNLNNANVTITPPASSLLQVNTMTLTGSSGSCTNSAVFTLTVIPNPTIAVTSGSMCAGKSVTLTTSGASTFTWSPNTALNTTNGPTVIANPANTTIYSVIGSSLGCNSQTQNGTASVVINPTVTITPPNPVICLGNSINLTASGASTYTWSPNIALTTTNAANTTANPTVTTTYSVLGSQATCTNIGVVTVTVLGLPSVTVTPSSPTLCMNNFNGSPNTVSLTANGAASYTWGPVTGLTTNTLNGSTIIGTSNGAAVATGTVIGANGTCTNLATFTVNAIPNPSIAVTSGSMCAGTSVQLVSSGATTYTWSPNTALNTTNGPTVIANPANTTVYSVIGSSLGCNSQTQNGTASVVINPTPSIAPLTPTICFGSSINLTASGATNFTWSPNTAISNTTGVNVSVSPTVTTTYTVIGEQATCTNTAVRTVTVIDLPVINIALSSPTLCMNNYNNSPNTINVNASGASTYNWLGFSGLSPSSMSGANITVTSILSSPVGTGTVIGSTSTCTNSASFTIAAIPNPIIAIPSASMCYGTSVALNASGATTFTWSPSSSLNSAFGQSVIANPFNTTVYSVIGTSLNCNSTTQTTTVDVVANPTLFISPVNPTICAGSPVNLSASGASSYTWSPSNSLDNSTNANVIATPSITTVYTVIGSLNTCTSSTTRQVTVVPLPTLQAEANPPAICQGDKTTINANGAYSYTWSPIYGLSNANSNFVVANPTITTIYTLIGNNGACTASLSVPVVVLAKPVINLTTSNPRICYGSNSTIFASGAQNFVWMPDTNLNHLNTNVAIASPSVSTNYTVIGTNSSGSVNCVMTQEIFIEVVKQVTATVSNSVSICKGESVRMSSGGSNTYVWYPASGLSNSLVPNPYASPTISTVYTVNVSNGGICGASSTVMVKVNPLPDVNAGEDKVYNLDEPMYLNATGNGTLTWVFGDAILCKVCPNTQIMPENSSCYKIEAVNEYGCKAIDDVCIEVTKDHNIYIPNIFTPNFDGLNDVFLVYGTGIVEIEMIIFDRWGEKLYTSTDQLKGWDGTYKGTLSKNDVYVYLVNYKSLDGKKHTRTGHVTLMK